MKLRFSKDEEVTANTRRSFIIRMGAFKEVARYLIEILQLVFLISKYQPLFNCQAINDIKRGRKNPHGLNQKIETQKITAPWLP